MRHKITSKTWFKTNVQRIGKWTIAGSVLIQSLFFVLLFLWLIRECVRLVILNKCTNVWQMNYCPLLSWFNHYFLVFCSFVPLVNKRVCSASDLKQMYKCLANELLPVAVLIQSLFFGLLFLWSIRECVRLVILNKWTNDWQMNYCPLLSWFNHYFLVFCSFGLYECVRLVILNKWTNVWQMNHYPLLSWFNHYFLVFCSFGQYECMSG